MGAVGNGTTIEYVEVFQNLDDGFEWFGGAVNCKHLIAAFCGDDAFDFDESYSGAGQFWFNIKDEGDKSGEHDGGPDDYPWVTPFATPLISNATYVGAGVGAAGGVNGGCFNIRDNCSPAYYNSIFHDHNGYGISIEQVDPGVEITDSEDRLLTGDLVFQNNVWGRFADGYDHIDIANGQTWTDTLWRDPYFFNYITHPGIWVTRQPDGMNDPRPYYADCLPQWTDPTVYNPPSKPGHGGTFTGWFDEVDYVGAFDPDADIADLWAYNWTAFDFYGYLGENNNCTSPISNSKPVKVFDNDDMVGEVTMYADTIYNLDGFVFVEDGEVLNIEPGTVVKSNPGQAADATALIVSRGGKMFANGTRECPIIFTSISDNVDLPDDILPGDTGRGLWGGVLLLGRSVTNLEGGVGYIEGVPPQSGTAYGDSTNVDEQDNSGELRYVSIRHGGSVIGGANEINGLTMGAVGRLTTLCYIEVFQNLDDGFEFFGGTQNAKYLVVAFCGDDSYDVDEAYSGAGQFWFTLKDEGDKGGEHDGGPDDYPEVMPYATPVVSNVTYLGAGVGASGGVNSGCFNIRDNCSPAYYNSIFSDHNGCGISIEQVDPLVEPTDSEDRLLVGDLVFEHNVWGLFADGTEPNDIACGQSWTEVLFTDGSRENEIGDPQICVTRTPTGDNDPRPASWLSFFPEWTDPTAYNPPAKPNHGQLFTAFFEEVPYLGAFDPNKATNELWIYGWSAFGTPTTTSGGYGYLGENEACECCGLYAGGYTGNCNCDVEGKRNLADITQLISRVYLTPDKPLCCEPNGNTNGDPNGTLNLADITKLIDHVYISQAQTAPCP
jgi:hypothetical protein